MNPDTLISVHGYAGDKQQIEMLEIVYRHHNCPVVIISPEDSPIRPSVPGFEYCHAGERAYIGRKSWDRQHLQMKKLLAEYSFEWILMNDSDSFCFQPELPEYLYEDKNTLWANKVDDFRIPGETWTDKNGSVTWPLDFHLGHELVALQPPYFCHREVLEKMVIAHPLVKDDEITPFIDWYMVACADAAGVTHKRFENCVSCETETAMGLRLVGNHVWDGAIFIHAVKRPDSFLKLCQIYWDTLQK